MSQKGLTWMACGIYRIFIYRNSNAGWRSKAVNLLTKNHKKQSFLLSTATNTFTFFTAISNHPTRIKEPGQSHIIHQHSSAKWGKNVLEKSLFLRRSC